ncbi:abortive infection family protein (plasmid) [Streptomyces nojiriensis]|uniref:abortive infection family protein n=1 Tax=Streptomyces nojiriensis TaxID=66374 RepID=UPI002E19273F
MDIKVRLDRDGYHLNDEGQISWINPPVLVRDLSGLNDPSGIIVELERIRRDLTTDPQGAIGAAKQLIEATTKTAPRELGVVVEKKTDVPILVAMVHKELRLDAASAPDGSKAIKRSGAVNIAVGVAELRNQGFGSGHGQASAPVRPRRPSCPPDGQRCRHVVRTDPRHPGRSECALTQGQSDHRRVVPDSHRGEQNQPNH